MAAPTPDNWQEYINRKIGIDPSLVPMASASGKVAMDPQVNQQGFDQAKSSDVLAMPVASNNVLSQAIASKSAKKNSSSQQSDSKEKKPGESDEEYMKRTGQQDKLDQMNKQEALKAPIEPPPVPSPNAAVIPMMQEKTYEQQMAESGRQSELDNMAVKPDPVPTPQSQAVSRVEQPQPSATPQEPTQEKPPTPSYKPGSLGENVTVTGRANQYYSDNPAYGVNRGTDFAGEAGTAVSLPEGNWRVVESRNDVKGRMTGNFSQASNQGWGNSVVVENLETGEKLRMSHMQYGSVPDLKPGQEISGGTVIGAIGNTGNTRGTTGNHLDVEYYNSNGQRGDVLNTRYAEGLFIGGKQQPEQPSAIPQQQSQPVPQTLAISAPQQQQPTAPQMPQTMPSMTPQTAQPQQSEDQMNMVIPSPFSTDNSLLQQFMRG